MSKLGPRQTKFVEALESGLYKQCKSVLKKDDSYCCLGVATQLAVDAGIEMVKWHIEELNIMPESVMDYYAFQTCDGCCISDEGMPSLWWLNDGRNYNFKEIALYIRENADRIFERPV